MTKALIQKIHIAKAQLQLDDDTYRDALRLVTGKDSCKACSEAELEKVLKHFSKAGFKPKGKPFTGPSSKLAAKIHALWISGWNLGVIRDNSDTAMEAFILRQTGVAKAQWLKNGKDAAKVIDALKAWLSREGGVDWSTKGYDGKHLKPDPQIAVIVAQRHRLFELGVNDPAVMAGDPISRQKAMGEMIRKAIENR